VVAALLGILIQYSMVLKRTWPLVRPIAAPRARLWARLAGEAWPLGVNSTVITIHQQVPLLAVSFVSLHQAGLFSAAGRIPQQLSLVPIIVQNTFFPLLAERWSTDPVGFRLLTERLVAGSMIVAIPVLILGAASAHWIVVTLFGESFAGATLSFVLLTAMYCLLIPGILASEALIAAGFSRMNFWIGVTSLPVLALLLAALIPIGGAAGAAAAVLSTIAAMLIGVGLVTYRLLRISYGKSLLAGATGFAAGAVTAFAIEPGGSVVAGLAGAGVSAVVMFALIPSARHDALRLWDILGRRRPVLAGSAR
jgi:O-antigen/teichoic acid export membrane protein